MRTWPSRSRAAIERTAYGEPVQGAVEFLVRRMQRRQDFPALSRSLVEINRMTSKDSNATASQLATGVVAARRPKKSTNTPSSRATF